MAAKAEYSATTRQISVSVNPIYLDDRSAPEHNHFVWAYYVVIENRGADAVRHHVGQLSDAKRAW